MNPIRMTVTVDTERHDALATNEAATAEMADALRDIADKMQAGQDEGIIRDSNGNRIGDWCVDLIDLNDDDLKDNEVTEAT